MAILLLAAVPACVRPEPETSTNLPGDPSFNAHTVTIFLTGNTLSTLKPCGCTTGQLGGLDRRSAIFHSTPADRRILVDTGNFLMQDSQQDRIKLGVLLQAMTLLEYDIIHLDTNDFRVVKEMGLLDAAGSQVLTPTPKDDIPAVIETEMSVSGRMFKVTIASIQSADMDPGKLAQLFGKKGDTAKVNLLIVDSSQPAVIDAVAGTDLVDVLIVPAAATEPRIVDRSRMRPLVISVGKFGEYVAKLSVEVRPDQSTRIRFSDVAVTEQLPMDQALVDLYKFYQTLVREEKLLDLVPQIPLSDGLAFVGSNKCQICHEYAYSMWSQKKHAIAYPTLVKVEHQYDPECVKCHVIGLGYETGFQNESSPVDLREVGCESCHGPGNLHIESVLTQKQYVSCGNQPRMRCVDCHTSEHSSGFGGHEREYFQKIIHWKEPKAEDAIQYLSGAAGSKGVSVNTAEESSDKW